MSGEDLKLKALMEEFDHVTKALDDVLKDLEWRKPDVEAEEAKLAELARKEKLDPGEDVASQRIVVRVLREVLDDKIQLAEALEQKMLILKNHIESLGTAVPKKGKRGKRGKAIREKA